MFLRLRENFLTSLHEEIKSYFPNGSLKHFEVFIPKNLPKTVNEAFTYGLIEIQTLAERFELDAILTSKEWIDLLISTINHNKATLGLQ